MNPAWNLSCKLTAPELQKRKATVIAELKSLVVSKQELPGGFLYRFPFTDQIFDTLTTFIKTERLCCDFFTFKLTIAGEFADLEISGPEGTKSFLKEEIGF
jgi:hypothetical protein